MSDLTKEIAVKYGVLLEKPGIALRGLFIIDKEGKLRHITVTICRSEGMWTKSFACSMLSSSTKNTARSARELEKGEKA